MCFEKISTTMITIWIGTKGDMGKSVRTLVVQARNNDSLVQ